MRFFPGRRRTRRAAVAAVALLTLAAAGCADASPDVVAYVGPAQVTQDELDQALTGLRSTLQEGQTISTEAVVNALIQGEIARQVADANQIAVTDGERDAVLQGSELEPLLRVPDARQVVYAVADTQVVPEKVGADAYLAAVAATDVELNPRFGRLDAQQKTLVSGGSGSLSVPADGAAESP